jgi:hypothetical protein
MLVIKNADLVTVEEVLQKRWRLDDGNCVVHREDSYTIIIPLTTS